MLLQEGIKSINISDAFHFYRSILVIKTDVLNLVRRTSIIIYEL